MVTLEGEQVVVTPVGDDVVIIAEPVKPLRLVSVNVLVPVEPVLNVTLVGLVVSEKSRMDRLMLTECERNPDWPVAVTT